MRQSTQNTDDQFYIMFLSFISNHFKPLIDIFKEQY